MDTNRDLACDDYPVREVSFSKKAHNETAPKSALNRQAISKMDRSELEDKYLTLYDESLILKKYARKQDREIKQLCAMQVRLENDKKKFLQDPNAKKIPDVHSVELIEQLQEKIQTLEKQNGAMKLKLMVVRQQMNANQSLRSTVYGHVPARIDTGIPKAPVDPRIMKSLRAINPPGTNRSSSAQNDNGRFAEMRKLECLVQEQQEKLNANEQEILTLREQMRINMCEHEDEINKLKHKFGLEQRTGVQENIDKIRTERELKEKGAKLTQLHDQYCNLEDKFHEVKSSHDQLIQELESLNNQLKREQSKCLSLQNQLKSGATNHTAILETQTRICDLEKECEILKEANERLVHSAFDMEKEREWRQKETSLKVQIAQLEATLRADVGEKGGILDKLSEERDQRDQMQCEHQELRIKYFELKQKYDDLVEKMSFFSKDSAVNYEEIEEALVIVKQRREACDPGLDFLQKVDEERTKDLDKLVKKLEADHAETINDLEKTRNMLTVQYKISQDYQKEVDIVTKKMDENKREFDCRLDEYAQLLDIRATRIRKLEAQMRDVAYGTRQYRLKPEEQMSDEEDVEETIELELGQNLFEIHVKTLILSEEGLKLMGDREPNVFCTWEFYEFEMQSTVVQRGPKVDFEFTSQYAVQVDDFFLHYLQKDSCVLELHQSFGTDYQTVAAGNIKMHELLEKSSGRLHGTVQLTGIQDEGCGRSYGVVDYWVRLRVPMEQALRLYKERSKAMGYLESNLLRSDQTTLAPLDSMAAKRAPDNVNQLHVNIISCNDIESRKRDLQPSPFCVYKFFDFPDHDSSIIPCSNSPQFDDQKIFPIAMTADLDKYLKSQQLKIYVFDDTDPEKTAYLGVASIPLIPLSHDKPISGTFELKKEDSSSNGTIEISICWQYTYLPPKGTTKLSTMQGSSTSGVFQLSMEEPISMLPGERDSIKHKVISGAPGTKGKSKSGKHSPPEAGPSASSTPYQSSKSGKRSLPEPGPSASSTPYQSKSVSGKRLQSPDQQLQSASFQSESVNLSLVESGLVDDSIISEGSPVPGESVSVSEDEDVVVTPKVVPRAKIPSKSPDSDKRSSASVRSDGKEDTMFEEKDSMLRPTSAASQVSQVSSARSEDADADVVLPTATPRRPQSIINGSNSGDYMRIDVSQVVLVEDSPLLHNSNIKMLYVAYQLLGEPLSETETPYSLPKPTLANKPISFNFTKVFKVDYENNYERRQYLASMLLPNDPDAGRIRFTVVSEPQDDDGDCEDVGVAIVSIPDILKRGRDLVNEDVPIHDENDQLLIGYLTLTVECLAALQAIEREITDTMHTGSS